MRQRSTDLNKRSGTELAVVKFVYVAVGGLAAAAIAVLVLLGSGLVLPGQQDRPEIEVFPPTVTVIDVSVTSVEADNAEVTVKFSVSNPNQRSMYMEALQYDLYVNDKQLTRGQWGDIANAFLVGSEGVLIVAGGSSTIPAVTTTVERKSQIAEEWDSIVDGSAVYTITGSSAYRLTQANFETSADEDMFSITFP